jgi:uncharacterized protein YegP (UPF0339 family)
MRDALSARGERGEMNEQLTRVSLGQAGNGNTDWDRVRTLTDAEIDAAISGDPDTFALSDAELDAIIASKQADHARYYILQTRDGHFRWYLMGASGAILAAAYEGAATKEEAQAGIMALRAAAIEAAPGAN